MKVWGNVVFVATVFACDANEPCYIIDPSGHCFIQFSVRFFEATID